MIDIILYVFDDNGCCLIPPTKYKLISILSGLFRSMNLSDYKLHYITVLATFTD